jgi:DNA-binding NarL/FixJ family response regulator
LTILRSRLADARAGSGRLALVCGPAGIGKTRLIEELAANRGDVPLGWGGALADSGMPALWPWTRALRGFARPYAALAAVVGGGGLGDYGSAEDAAAATFAADTTALDALAETAAEAGMLLILEDLQWADGATFRLLERLAADVRRLPLLVVATDRDAAHPALAGLLAHAGTEVLRLGPLTTEEAETLLAAAVDEVDPRAVRQAAERSGGSPLYLRTLCQIAGDQLRGRAPWTDASDAPEFRHLVSAALRAAGPRATAAVEAASVLGAVAPIWLLARLLDLDSADDADVWLRPAVPAGLLQIRSAPRPEVCFAHALVRDAAYALLPATRRIDLHRRAAELLEPLAIGHDERAGAVSGHWQRAGQPRRAVEWAVRAADAARAAGAYKEAERYLRLALDATHPDGLGADDAPIPVDRAELLLDLARAQYLGGRLEESLDSCRRAAGEGEASGRADVVARAAIIIQGVGHPTLNQVLAELCRRALDLLDASASGPLQARVEAQLACALFGTGQHDEAVQWSVTALTHATASGDQNAELDAIQARASLIWLPGFDRELLELGRRSIELSEPTRRPLARLWAHVWRGDSAYHLGDLAGSLDELDQLRVLADRTGSPLVRWHLLRRSATLAALTGDFAGCRAFAAEAVVIAANWHDESVRGTHLGLLTSLALLRGDPADLPDGWTEVAATVGHLLPVGRAVIAAALTLVGRRDEVTALYQPLLRSVPQLSGINLAALAYLTDVARTLGDADGCRQLRTAIAKLFGDTVAVGAGTVFMTGSLARMLGELDVGCGDFAVAVPHLEEGLRVDTLLGARPFVARGHLGLAQAFRATGGLAQSAEHGRVALADARRLDMPGVVREAETVLAELGAAAPTPSTLTPREREVAELVAQGLSNREVADRLVLSERTVESHVRNMLTKTGLRSRTELTRWVLQDEVGTHLAGRFRRYSE